MKAFSIPSAALRSILGFNPRNEVVPPVKSFPRAVTPSAHITAEELRNLTLTEVYERLGLQSEKTVIVHALAEVTVVR